MVGDTVADMHMGRLAKLGTTVGVLSGVGDSHELGIHADHIVC
jgi:phosphoglycolate phosphatase-like HAD superfamily hydrolase